MSNKNVVVYEFCIFHWSYVRDSDFNRIFYWYYILVESVTRPLKYIFLFSSACKWRTRWGASRTQPVNLSTLNSVFSPENLERTSAYSIVILLLPNLQNRWVPFLIYHFHSISYKNRCISANNVSCLLQPWIQYNGNLQLIEFFKKN